MEVFTIIIGLVIVVFGILQIILFFKLWGMTDNVRKIANDLGYLISTIKSQNNPNIKVGEVVLERGTSRKLTIMDVYDDGCLCRSEDGNMDRVYGFDEIIEFDSDKQK